MNVDTKRLVELRERVNAATGPDRELDLALAQALDPGVIHSRFYRDSNAVVLYAKRHYTASIDADLALVERVLPGWSWLVRSPYPDSGNDDVEQDDGKPFANLFPYGTPNNGPRYKARASTPPLAILSALLSALIALAEADAGQEGGA